MKQSNIFKALFLLTVFLLFSCSSGNDEPTKKPKNDTILISVNTPDDKREFKKGETVKFTVKNQDGKVLDKDITIFINDNKIEGTSFKFEKTLNYRVYAKYKELRSTEIEINITRPEITLGVVGEKAEVEVGGTLSFVVKDHNDKELKEDVLIYVDRTKIDGFSYKFEELRDYIIYAKYDGVKSQELTVKTTAPESTYVTKVLLEDYTGTWCGYCPRMVTVIENAVEEFDDKVIPVALHADDPFNFTPTKTLMNTFGIEGFPYLKINRTTESNESNSQIEKFVNNGTNLGLAISSNLSENKLNVKVKVEYDYTVTKKNKLVVYLLENGLKADQKNYYNNDSSSPYYKKGNPIKDFNHDHVVRLALTNILGDAIPEDKNTKGGRYEKDFSITLPSKIKNNTKLELVAFVADKNKNVLNAQKAKVGEDKDFDKK